MTFLIGKCAHARFFHFQIKPEVEDVRHANGGVLVLDKGTQIWQFNRKNSVGKERFKAAEYTRGIAEERETKGQFGHVGVCATYRCVCAYET